MSSTTAQLIIETPSTTILNTHAAINMDSKNIFEASIEILQGGDTFNTRSLHNPTFGKISLAFQSYVEPSTNEFIPANTFKKRIQQGTLSRSPSPSQNTFLTESSHEIANRKESEHRSKGREVERFFHPIYNREQITTYYTLESEGPRRYFKFKPEAEDALVYARVLSISGKLESKNLDHRLNRYEEDQKIPDEVWDPHDAYILVEWISKNGDRNIQTLTLKEFKTISWSELIFEEAQRLFTPQEGSKNLEALKILAPMSPRRHVDTGGPLHSLRAESFVNLSTVGAEGSGVRNVYDHFSEQDPARVIQHYKNKKAYLIWAIDENGRLITSWFSYEMSSEKLKIPLSRLVKGRRIFVGGVLETGPGEIPTVYIKDVQYEYVSDMHIEVLEKVTAVFDLYWPEAIQVSSRIPDEYSYAYRNPVRNTHSSSAEDSIQGEPQTQKSSSHATPKKPTGSYVKIPNWFQSYGNEIRMINRPLEFQSWSGQSKISDQKQWARYILGFSPKENPTSEQSKKMWRKLNSTFHPDKPSADLNVIQIVNAAYLILEQP